MNKFDLYCRKLRNGMYQYIIHGRNYITVYRYPIEFNWELYDLKTGRRFEQTFNSLEDVGAFLEKEVINSKLV